MNKQLENYDWKDVVKDQIPAEEATEATDESSEGTKLEEKAYEQEVLDYIDFAIKKAMEENRPAEEAPEQTQTGKTKTTIKVSGKTNQEAIKEAADKTKQDIARDISV